jgi:hypothetical protein
VAKTTGMDSGLRGRMNTLVKLSLLIAVGLQEFGCWISGVATVGFVNLSRIAGSMSLVLIRAQAVLNVRGNSFLQGDSSNRVSTNKWIGWKHPNSMLS